MLEGMPVQLTLAGCDGGQKEESSAADNVLSGNWTATQCKSWPVFTFLFLIYA